MENQDIAKIISSTLDTGNFEAALTALQNEMLHNLPQAECPVIHRFSPGLYIRELSMAAGLFVIGHYQKTHHLNIFLKGKVRMVGPEGEVTELTAPMIFTAPPGRKSGYILEDTVWLNVYPTTETDISKLENTYLDLDKNKDFQAEEHNRLISKDASEDREDYHKMLSEMGYTEEEARRQSEITIDRIEFPQGSYKVRVAESSIEGKGLHATASIENGEIIAPARLSGKRTPAGRYTNHAKMPNAEMVLFGDDLYLVAVQGINGCMGGRLGDEITTDYRETLRLRFDKRAANEVEICQQQ